MAAKMSVEEKRLYSQLSKLREKIALSDSDEECQMFYDQMAEIKDKLVKFNRKAPVIVPIKNAATMGDRKERRLKLGKRPTSSTYNRSTVKI